MQEIDYDVFISFKNSDNSGKDTLDKEVAHKVYNFLKAKGLNIFFSPITLEELGRDEWSTEINNALLASKVCIALATSKYYMEERWPQKERTTFLALKMQDPKRAIYSYIAPPMTTYDLPDDIQKVECFEDEKENSLARLATFIQNHLKRTLSPKALEHQAFVERSNFSQEVFEHLDRNPMLLFSTDTFNHNDYIEHIKEEAIHLFGKEHLIQINCGAFASIKDDDKFFRKLGKKLKFGTDIEDAFDFQEAMVEHFESVNGLKTFILIVGIERLSDEVRSSFAEVLRTLQEEHREFFNLVIFGGKKLIELKYSNGSHSYFNTFAQKLIPTPSLVDWKKNYPYLLQEDYQEVVMVTGGYQRLTEYCFKNRICTKEDAGKLIYESYLKSELFRAYKTEKALCELLKQENLGDAHPYSDNPLLYRLYWDNLIVEQRGKFVWRSAFIRDLGWEMVGCESKKSNDVNI